MAEAVHPVPDPRALLGHAHPPVDRCVCSPHTVRCDGALYYGSYFHHTSAKDAFAAFCHPPAPPQLAPCLASMELTCRTPPPPLAERLTLPRLVSSVSETRLDAKKQPQECCSLHCSWIRPLTPFTSSNQHKNLIPDQCCPPLRVWTCETGTMTTQKVLKHVGVQTGERSPGSHVFPEVVLSEDGIRVAGQSPGKDSGVEQEVGGGLRPIVKEVKWDEEGMTWEVYGASVDPQELGSAIQKHLELQIKETNRKLSQKNPQNPTQQKNTSQQNREVSHQRRRKIRPPACCSSSAAD